MSSSIKKMLHTPLPAFQGYWAMAEKPSTRLFPSKSNCALPIASTTVQDCIKHGAWNTLAGMLLVSILLGPLWVHLHLWFLTFTMTLKTGGQLDAFAVLQMPTSSGYTRAQELFWVMAVKLWPLFSVKKHCPSVVLSVVVKTVLASLAARAARPKHRNIADTSQANSVIAFSLGEISFPYGSLQK